ncbi:MAG: hypothetical protein AAFW98_09210, partial [Pseudomonadota bacterium]
SVILLATPALGADVTLRLGHFAAETHPGHIAAKQFAERVAERTDGAVEVELYPANELGSPPEQLEQTVLGAIDMNLPTHGAVGTLCHALGEMLCGDVPRCVSAAKWPRRKVTSAANTGVTSKTTAETVANLFSIVSSLIYLVGASGRRASTPVSSS